MGSCCFLRFSSHFGLLNAALSYSCSLVHGLLCSRDCLGISMGLRQDTDTMPKGSIHFLYVNSKNTKLKYDKIRCLCLAFTMPKVARLPNLEGDSGTSGMWYSLTHANCVWAAPPDLNLNHAKQGYFSHHTLLPN